MTLCGATCDGDTGDILIRAPVRIEALEIPNHRNLLLNRRQVLIRASQVIHVAQVQGIHVFVCRARVLHRRQRHHAVQPQVLVRLDLLDVVIVAEESVARGVVPIGEEWLKVVPGGRAAEQKATIQVVQLCYAAFALFRKKHEFTCCSDVGGAVFRCPKEDDLVWIKAGLEIAQIESKDVVGGADIDAVRHKKVIVGYEVDCEDDPRGRIGSAQAWPRLAVPLGNARVDNEFRLLLAFQIYAVPGLELGIESRAAGELVRLDGLASRFKAGMPSSTN